MFITTHELDINWEKLFELLKSHPDVIVNEDLSLGYITDEQFAVHYDMVGQNLLEVTMTDTFDPKPYTVQLSSYHQITSFMLRELFFDLFTIEELLAKNIIPRGNCLYIVTSKSNEHRINGVFTNYKDAYEKALKLDRKKDLSVALQITPVNKPMNNRLY